MAQDSSAKYCQKAKKGYKQSSSKVYLSEEEKKKNENMDANDIKISLKMKNKSWF